MAADRRSARVVGEQQQPLDQDHVVAAVRGGGAVHGGGAVRGGGADGVAERAVDGLPVDRGGVVQVGVAARRERGGDDWSAIIAVVFASERVVAARRAAGGPREGVMMARAFFSPAAHCNHATHATGLQKISTHAAGLLGHGSASRSKRGHSSSGR